MHACRSAVAFHSMPLYSYQRYLIIPALCLQRVIVKHQYILSSFIRINSQIKYIYNYIIVMRFIFKYNGGITLGEMSDYDLATITRP